MNKFTSDPSEASSKVPRHLESLVTSVFHGLFPPINPQAMPLKSIRRVLLLNREKSKDDENSFVLNFRHYAITTKATGVSKPLKRLNAAERLMNSKSRKGKLPNLSKLQDIADYMIGGENGDGYTTDGATSGSEVDTDAEVDVLETAPRKVLTSKARAAAAAAEEEGAERPRDRDEKVERRAVKLVELGPRLKLRLTKVEEGLCTGKVMWHEYIHKSKEEIKELEKVWEKRKQEKAARRQVQKENVEKKRKAKAQQSGQKGGDEDDDEMDLDDLGSDDYEFMDDEDTGFNGDAKGKPKQRVEDGGQWESDDEDDE